MLRSRVVGGDRANPRVDGVLEAPRPRAQSMQLLGKNIHGQRGGTLLNTSEGFMIAGGHPQPFHPFMPFPCAVEGEKVLGLQRLDNSLQLNECLDMTLDLLHTFPQVSSTVVMQFFHHSSQLKTAPPRKGSPGHQAVYQSSPSTPGGAHTSEVSKEVQ